MVPKKSEAMNPVFFSLHDHRSWHRPVRKKACTKLRRTTCVRSSRGTCAPSGSRGGHSRTSHLGEAWMWICANIRALITAKMLQLGGLHWFHCIFNTGIVKCGTLVKMNLFSFLFNLLTVSNYSQFIWILNYNLINEVKGNKRNGKTIACKCIYASILVVQQH